MSMAMMKYMAWLLVWSNGYLLRWFKLKKPLSFEPE